MKQSLLLVTSLLVFSYTANAAPPDSMQEKQLQLMRLEQSATLDSRIDRLLDEALRKTNRSLHLLDASFSNAIKPFVYTELLQARSQ